MNSPFTQRANECVRLTSPLLAASTPNQENNPRPAPARPQPKTQMPESGNPVAAHQARPNTPMGAHRSSMATTAHSATTTDQMAR